jgi:energy-coupling factor transporter ATP-binding protein EcfA2
MVAKAKAQAEACESLKIGQVTCHHFMQFEVLEADFAGKSVEITGPNGSGKSTILNAIYLALGEMTGREIPEPIMAGKDSADCSVKLLDAKTGKLCFVVKREWSRDGKPAVDVFAPDGSRFGRPQEFINGLKDSLCVRPFTWLLRREQDQLDDVLRLYNVQPPVEEVRGITGQDESPGADESAAQYLDRLSADKTGSYYVQRLMAHQRWQQKRGALNDHRGKLATMAASAGDDGVDLTKMLAQRQDLEARREKSRAMHQHVAELERGRSEVLERIAAYTRERQAASDRAGAIERKIAELQAELARERETIKDRGARLDVGAQKQKEVEAALAAAREAASVLPDPSPEIVALDRGITEHQRHAAENAKRAAAQEMLLSLEEEAAAAEKDYGKCDLVLTQLRELRRSMLNGLDLGVSGLEVGDGELKHNGVPFKQASTAQRMIVACAIVARRNPRLRFLGMDDAEHFDVESVKIVKQQAAKHDWQLALTFVESGDGLKVRFCVPSAA